MAGSAAIRVLSLLASAVRAAASVIAVLILVYAVLVLFEANPTNDLVQFTAGIRDTFGWFTENLFTLSKPRFSEAVNAALAGVAYLVGGSIVSTFVAPLTPAPRTRV